MNEDKAFHFGPTWAVGTQCCGKPVGCSNMTPQCLMRNHPWKKSIVKSEDKEDSDG